MPFIDIYHDLNDIKLFVGKVEKAATNSAVRRALNRAAQSGKVRYRKDLKSLIGFKHGDIFSSIHNYSVPRRIKQSELMKSRVAVERKKYPLIDYAKKNQLMRLDHLIGQKGVKVSSREPVRVKIRNVGDVQKFFYAKTEGKGLGIYRRVSKNHKERIKEVYTPFIDRLMFEDDYESYYIEFIDTKLQKNMIEALAYFLGRIKYGNK